ncbi:MAG: hypothetical protein Q9195_004512 [Heterodermia aff. obscurata]
MAGSNLLFTQKEKTIILVFILMDLWAQLKFRDEYPKGFPRLACFLDSDDAFMTYRRFGLVFSRLLLNKQDEIQELEGTLLAMDNSDLGEGNSFRGRGQERAHNCWKNWRGRRSNTVSASPWDYTTLRLINMTAELLLKNRGLKNLEKPSAKDYRSVLHFMENDGGQLYEEESGWIYNKEDLVTLRPGRDYAWLDGFLESILRTCRCKALEVNSDAKS